MTQIIKVMTINTGSCPKNLTKAQKKERKKNTITYKTIKFLCK